MKLNLKPKQYACVIILSLFTLLHSCTDKETPIVDDPIKRNEPVFILNSESGFTQFFDKVVNTQGIAGSLPGEAIVYDFSLESNNNFNFAYSTSASYQQGTYTYYSRYSFNMDTKTEVPLPKYASAFSPIVEKGAGQFLSMVAYRPYTNFLVYSVTQRAGSGLNPYTQATIGGDLKGTIPRSYRGIGTPDMGYQFPMFNPEYYTQASFNGNVMSGFFTTDHLFSVVNPQMVFRDDIKLKGSWLDISGVKKLGTVYSFDLTTDSFIVNTLTNFQDPNEPVTAMTTATFETGVPINFSLADVYTVIRHYTPDGKIMGILIGTVTTHTFSTFSYNYETNTLTKGLQGVSLDYAGEGSDIEIDEYGNVYYTGYAGNGTNTAGVSIYKKSIDGANTLVGKDNFLKFGKVVKLKLYDGKLYLAVTGQITGTSFQQMSFIKQD